LAFAREGRSFSKLRSFLSLFVVLAFFLAFFPNSNLILLFLGFFLDYFLDYFQKAS